jgi:hypothetical protein
MMEELMDDRSARLSLPLLAAGQAQKELTHNEALGLLDLLVQPVVQSAGDNVPPPAPIAGQCWIVGAAPIADWAGQAGAIAGWTDGGWRFVAAVEGLVAWVAEDTGIARFYEGSWHIGILSGSRVVIDGMPVIGARAAAIPGPSGGTVVDVQARAAIETLLSALRGHGLIAI